MGLYDLLVNAYNQFLGLFPASLGWVITLLILIGVIGALIALIRRNAGFIIVALVLLPFLIPVAASFATDIYNFIRYLISSIGQIFI